MQTYTFSDLSEHSTQVLRNAEDGKLALFTNQGQPLFVAVPFGETTLKNGLLVDLAIKLFDEEIISLGRAAEIAHMNRIDLMNHESSREHGYSCGALFTRGIGRLTTDIVLAECLSNPTDQITLHYFHDINIDFQKNGVYYDTYSIRHTRFPSAFIGKHLQRNLHVSGTATSIGHTNSTPSY